MKRRRFVKTVSSAGLGIILGPRSPAEKVVVCVMGLNGRGSVLAKTFAKTANAEVAAVCDVDTAVLAKAAAAVSEAQGKQVKTLGDFRRALDDKSIDALVIAAPDHWHAPAAILAMSAGKHVYLEKPCGHNAREGELLVDARGTIGRGKAAPVPANLDYDLWQGPAPHTPYHDNVIHYNWHWFRRWGTGEICNNGTHEIDVCRWALGVDRCSRVTSTGGRYHFDDDWEFPDSQEAVFEFAGGKTIIWQGQSCNGLTTFGRERGTAILGTTGSVVMDRDGYVVYDLKNQVVKQSLATQAGDGLNISADDDMTHLHIANF
ncbi:MAG: hypothetical protein AUG74_14440, partial [Bacteroidetes bacterium 13_1_20CM_4_60_6]